MKAFEVFDKIIKALVVGLAIAMTCIEFTQIICRFVLKAPLAWSEELVRYMFIYTVFLAAGIGIDRGAHSSLDLLKDRVPAHAKKYYQTGIWVLAIAFFAMLTFYGIQLASANTTQLTPALRMPFSYVIMGVPIGSVVAIIYLIKNIAQLLTGKETEAPSQEGGDPV